MRKTVMWMCGCVVIMAMLCTAGSCPGTDPEPAREKAEVRGRLMDQDGRGAGGVKV
jgi:hypothetical protein